VSPAVCVALKVTVGVVSNCAEAEAEADDDAEEVTGAEAPAHPNSGAAVAHKPNAIKSSLRAMLDSLISSNCAARHLLML
jgi:hypothetical protein